MVVFKLGAATDATRLARSIAIGRWYGMESFAISDGVAFLTLAQGKANAMSEDLLDTLEAIFAQLDRSAARAAVITGYDRFFSAGLALPSLIDLDRAAMRRFISRFSDVMLRIFSQPRPLVAAINGHAIAGGCVLALECDYRIMAEGDFKIGLNEVQLGIGLPTVVTEALRLAVPASSLLPIAVEGQLVSPRRALELRLVDELVAPDKLAERARERATQLAAAPSSGVSQVKAALRAPARELMERLGPDEIERWLDTWFSDEARLRLRDAVTRLRR
jgi:enoyl-CoA hydratase/carnithine racemase